MYILQNITLSSHENAQGQVDILFNKITRQNIYVIISIKIGSSYLTMRSAFNNNKRVTV